MNLRLTELAIAVLLAGGFASVGELLIGLPSRTLSSWNDSFLVGLGACTALLFPFSVVAPRSALGIVLAVLGAGVLLAIARRVRRVSRAPRPPDAKSAPRDVVSLAFLVLIALMVVSFAILNLRLTFAWDGFQIWVTRAMVLHREGGLRPRLFSGADYEGRIVGYPNAVPMYEALLFILRGGFAFEAVKPIFLVFYLSLAVAFHRLARALLPARAAIVALALLLSVPGISGLHNLGGYADMPLAAAVTAAAGACAWLRTDERAGRAAPWLIGSLALIKNEGMVLAGVFALLIVAFVALDGVAALRRAGRRLAVGSGIVVGLCLAQKLYVRWTDTPDVTYGPIDWAHLARAPQVFPGIARDCLRELLDVDTWIFLWPAFLIAALVIAARGSRLERFLAAGCALVLSGYAAIYLFTTWDSSTHIHSSYIRLAEQVAPIAVVVLVAGALRGHAAWAGRSGTLADQELKVARQEP